MPREIGVAVQPRTYITERGGNLMQRMSALSRGMGEIINKDVSFFPGGSQRGYIAYARGVHYAD
jgi:hypothetical protein